MIELYPFQSAASDQIAERTVEYLSAPVEITNRDVTTRVPFTQFLSSVTASGKTIILTDAVSAIVKQLRPNPIILWLSKASVVVEQTYANLDAGGAYHELLDDTIVRALSEFDLTEVTDTQANFLLFATVGTFNQKDKEKGTRKVFQSSIDDAATSTWESLKLRPSPTGHRRPLLIVYDEAHNLSDQQTDLLLELEPAAFLLATATSRLPTRFQNEVVKRLKDLGGRSDEDLITKVDAAEVASSGLIKSQIELVGRQAPMEQVITELVDTLRQAERDATDFALPGPPKAVYVCRTNVIEGSDERDEYRRPFEQREAPPILIWRHLTETLGVDPEEIAVYCNLKVDKNYPLPNEFVLFGGGDTDYERFVEGNYRHIIFNLALQEGWDEPLVYFAYIDKAMGSKVQAEQVIGRLLRQPGRRHYSAMRLNTAQIHVRVETIGVFEEVVSAVQEKIQSDDLPVQIIRTPPGSKVRVEYPAKLSLTIPVAAIVTDRAEAEIGKYIEQMTDYRHDDGSNVTGTGKRARVQRVVGSNAAATFEWEDYGQSARVVARWLFTRSVRKVHSGALGVAITSNGDGNSTKFDARIGLTIRAAAHVEDIAEKVGQAFVRNVYLKLRRPNPYSVGPLLQSEEGLESFQNAMHEGYSDLNPSLELPFARAIDKTGLAWCRNPSQTGYSIPLVQPGKTVNFYPDFLIWKEKDIFAIDTKGSHLHADALRKLVAIRPAGEDTPRVFVRFVSNGLVNEDGPQGESTGYTAWTFAPTGEPRFTHRETLDQALEVCLIPDV